jgi:hypothetical protein
MNRIGYFMVALFLGGCTITPPITDRMERTLHMMLGKNIKDAIAIWGYPDSQRTMFGDTIYVWSTDHQVTTTLPSVATTIGDIDGTPYSATTWGTETVSHQYSCRIQFATDPDGRIKSYQWRGNGGCAPYAQQLGF